jgi:hypothetical protein
MRLYLVIDSVIVFVIGVTIVHFLGMTIIRTIGWLLRLPLLVHPEFLKIVGLQTLHNILKGLSLHPSLFIRNI